MSRQYPLSTQTRKIWLIIRKNIAIDMFLIKQYLTIYADEYAFIEHKGDINLEGEVEGIHYHCVYNLKDKYKNDRLSTTLNHIVDVLKLDNAIGIQITKYDSFEGCLQYLTHKNVPEKTQHRVSEIVHNLDEKTFELLYNCDVGNSFSFSAVYSKAMTSHNKLEYLKSLWCFAKDSGKFRLINEVWELTQLEKERIRRRKEEQDYV